LTGGVGGIDDPHRFKTRRAETTLEFRPRLDRDGTPDFRKQTKQAVNGMPVSTSLPG